MLNAVDQGGITVRNIKDVNTLAKLTVADMPGMSIAIGQMQTTGGHGSDVAGARGITAVIENDTPRNRAELERLIAAADESGDNLRKGTARGFADEMCWPFNHLAKGILALDD